jgi:hypothetical protein
MLKRYYGHVVTVMYLRAVTIKGLYSLKHQPRGLCSGEKEFVICEVGNLSLLCDLNPL